jgi:hypothetical protein
MGVPSGKAAFNAPGIQVQANSSKKYQGYTVYNDVQSLNGKPLQLGKRSQVDFVDVKDPQAKDFLLIRPNKQDQQAYQVYVDSNNPKQERMAMLDKVAEDNRRAQDGKIDTISFNLTGRPHSLSRNQGNTPSDAQFAYYPQQLQVRLLTGSLPVSTEDYPIYTKQPIPENRMLSGTELNNIRNGKGFPAETSPVVEGK